MEGETTDIEGQRWNRWRIAGWALAGLILLIPLIAMQFTDEVNWSAADFVFAAVLLLAVGIPFELVVRKAGSSAYRAGAGVALVAAFLLVWVNGAVGIIGSEGNTSNLMYGGVIAIGFFSALIARFKPRGMAYAMYATTIALVLVATITLIAGRGAPYSGPMEIIGLNGFFIALFAGSGRLFQEAART